MTAAAETWREWDLHGLVVTQLRFDHAFSVHLWSMERGLLLRFETPFEVHPAGDAPWRVDPEDTQALAPLLGLLHRPAETFGVSSLDRCVLRLEDGTELRSARDSDYEAWASSGEGALADASGFASPGGTP